jgi:type 1 glutamine amidotransferase
MKFALTLILLVIVAATATAQPPKPHVVMLIAEREYETDKSLATYARERLDDKYRTTLVFADSGDPNRLAGIEAIQEADVLLVSVRRRALPKAQLDLIRDYVAAGTPVIGIRTASHAFSLRNEATPEGRAVWPQWDAEVFGGNYTNHYGNQLQATVTRQGAPSNEGRLLRGISAEPFKAGGSLYKVSPLADGAIPLLWGQVEGHDAEPVAWAYRRKDGGKSFYTSLGHVDDFRGPVLPKLLTNAIAWATQ